MPSKSLKQQRFFFAVKGAKHNPDAPANLKKVANSMSNSDIDDFTKGIAEFKIKKAILSVLKELQEPTPLNEESEGQNPTDPISDQWPKKEEWDVYTKQFLGQQLSSKEINAIRNFEKKKPNTLARTEVWYKGVDKFGISKTTLIKKMTDSGRFSFISFQKHDNPIEDKAEDDENKEMNAGSPTDLTGGAPTDLNNLGGPSNLGTLTEIPGGETSTGSTPPTESPEQQEKEKEESKDDIIVTKSILFKDDIKGAAILIEFLKKLNL